jgi:uncharacterized protein YeeX (DUF496 family)
MTNYEQLFQEQMENSHFAKAYYEVRFERKFIELLENLKDKIIRNEPKEELVGTVESIQKHINFAISHTEV